MVRHVHIVALQEIILSILMLLSLKRQRFAASPTPGGVAWNGMCSDRGVVIVIVELAVMVRFFASTAVLSVTHSLLRLGARRSEICRCC
jgi:hypothetical protein